jgi:hypothetical protein
MAILILIVIILIMTAAIIYASNRQKGGHISPKLKVFALSTALALVVFSAYWAAGVIIDEETDKDGFTWATFTVTIVVWLLALGLLAIRVNVSAVWVALGGVVGFVLAPFIVFTVFAITYEIWVWPKTLEMD